MVDVRRALKDVLAGGVFIVLGLAFALGALTYDLGQPLRMGPGYLPLALGLIQVTLGIMIIAKGFIAGEGEPLGSAEWRAIVLITAAMLFFGLTVRGLGVAGALFGASFMSALARSRTTWREALVIAVGLTILSVVIFIFALRLRLPLAGSWLPF